MTARPPRRSVSPFGNEPPAQDDQFADLDAAFRAAFPGVSARKGSSLKTFDDAAAVPHVLRRVANAPANDAAGLPALCDFLILHRATLAEKGVFEAVYRAMEIVFDMKTDLFMVAHHGREECEKMGWADEFRDVVLFAPERDTLIARFFVPATEGEPGRFAAFVNRWVETDSPDRLLHFFDFCVGSSGPTFEHYLLFSHPALKRLVSNKPLLRQLFEKTRFVLIKMPSTTWEEKIRTALAL